MWFINPKNVTIGSGVDQNNHWSNFALFLSSHRKLKLGQKDSNFWFWSTPEPIVKFSLKKRFLEHPVCFGHQNYTGAQSCLYLSCNPLLPWRNMKWPSIAGQMVLINIRNIYGANLWSKPPDHANDQQFISFSICKNSS